MKLKVFTTATLLGLLLPLAHAQVSQPIRGHVPFSFRVGDTVLPAGNYVVKNIGTSGPSALSIGSLEQKAGTIVFVTNEAGPDSKQNVRLVFHRYATTYFLSQIWTGGGNHGRKLSTSKAERVVARDMAATARPHNQELASVTFTVR